MTKPPIQAVIFDLDGLLIDSEIVWNSVRTEIAAQQGVTWTEGDHRAVMSFLTAEWVAYMTERLVTLHGAPGFIPYDNGPEFIARAAQEFLVTANIETLFIDPGSPWQNGCCESFNSRSRDELLNVEAFTSTLEARMLSEKWRRDYNEQRPHGALGYRTPQQVLEQALATGTLQAPELTAVPAQA